MANKNRWIGNWVIWLVSYRRRGVQARPIRRGRVPRRTKRSKAPWRQWVRGAVGPGTARCSGRRFQRQLPGRWLRSTASPRPSATRTECLRRDIARSSKARDLQGEYRRIHRLPPPIPASSIWYHIDQSVTIEISMLFKIFVNQPYFNIFIFLS